MFFVLFLSTGVELKYQTTVDYFSIDIEGHEKGVLGTIPWEKVDIKVIGHYFLVLLQ